MDKKTIGYISIVVILALAGFFSVNLYFQQRSEHDKLDIATFPYTVGNWKGRDIEIEEQVYKILETRNMIFREYSNSGGEKLILSIIYSETNRSVFHPPEVCMMGGGVQITDKESDEIKGDDYKFLTNKLYTDKNGYKQMVLYTYKAGKLLTDNFYLQQAYFALNQLFGKNARGATIRVSMHHTDESGEDVLPTLKDFMKESAKIIDRL